MFEAAKADEEEIGRKLADLLNGMTPFRTFSVKVTIEEVPTGWTKIIQGRDRFEDIASPARIYHKAALQRYATIFVFTKLNVVADGDRP